MISEDIEFRTAFSINSPMFERFYYCEQLLVMDVVVLLRCYHLS